MVKVELYKQQTLIGGYQPLAACLFPTFIMCEDPLCG